MYGSIAGISMALGSASGFFNKGLSVIGTTSDLLARFASIWHKHGETNRYTKSLERPPSTEPLPKRRPPIFDALDFEKYKYSPLSANPEQVRLLKLLPPTSQISDDCVRCEIFSTNL
jgi:hypothetical protein